MSLQYSYSVEIRISGDHAALNTVYLSLEPEKSHTDRTRVDIELKEKYLVLTIFSMDSTALRAAVNSYLQWLNEAMEIHLNTLRRIK